MQFSSLTFSGQQPSVMGEPGLVPPLAGGPVSQAPLLLPYTQVLLAEQEQRYGNGEQPPALVRQLPYYGLPLRFLLTGRQVKFCDTKEDVLLQYSTVPNGDYWPVPEYAACLQGPRGTGIVRARINKTGHAPSAIISNVADKLGLQRRPLRGPGAISTIWYNGTPIPLEVLAEPLTVQLLAGPDNIAMEITLPAVLVVPSRSESENVIFELQLGLYDFCAAVEVDWLPLWASQFTDNASGYRCALPVVAPRPAHVYRRVLGSSTFHIAQETYEEVTEIAMARQAVLARRAAAAAAATGASDGPSPEEAAAVAMQQARHVGAATAPAQTSASASVQEQAPAAGTQEWIDEWAPPTRRQQEQQQQRRQRGRGGQRGSRRSRGRGGRTQQMLHDGAIDADDAVAYLIAATSEAAAAAGAGAAATRAAASVYDGLDALPPSLVACRWDEVAATSLPEGEDTCSICMDTFGDDLEAGGERLVTQLRCRHTYCVLCLRQFSTNRTFRRQPLQCPQCRTEV